MKKETEGEKSSHKGLLRLALCLTELCAFFPGTYPCVNQRNVPFPFNLLPLSLNQKKNIQSKLQSEKKSIQQIHLFIINYLAI